MPTASPFDVAAASAPETAPALNALHASRVPRVLVIRRRYLGDIVLLGSVLRNLRLHWPSAWLAVLTEPAYAGVLRLNRDADAALTFPKGAAGWLKFVRHLRKIGFTHVLDFDNTDRTAIVTAVSGASTKATFDRELIPFRYRWAYTHVAKVTNAFYDSHHITDTYLALPAALGVPIRSHEVKLVPRADDLAAAQKMVPRGGNKVLVHPGTRSSYRVWPVERFAEVCDRLQDKLGAQVFVTAGANEQPLLAQIRAQARSHLVPLGAAKNPGALAALIAQFDVFLCHDSGPMHIASAVGTPVVALFGSQNATIWRPLGQRHTILQTSLPCACIGAAAPTPCVPTDSYRSYCVRKLAADDVFAAVTKTLATGK
jgi:ADP-heptose:LPS heptosyltransferase